MSIVGVSPLSTADMALNKIQKKIARSGPHWGQAQSSRKYKIQKKIASQLFFTQIFRFKSLLTKFKRKQQVSPSYNVYFSPQHNLFNKIQKKIASQYILDTYFPRVLIYTKFKRKQQVPPLFNSFFLGEQAMVYKIQKKIASSASPKITSTTCSSIYATKFKRKQQEA